MSKPLTLCLSIALLAGVSGLGLAQQTPKQAAKAPAKQESKKPVVMKEQTPGLLSKAKVPADSARKLASTKVPGGTLSKEELRQSSGKLVYSFYFKSANKSGVDAVDVDATSGTVADPRHESRTAAKAERKGGSTTQKAPAGKSKT
jgi:uncharacterized membrane protein YkoI